MLWLFRFKYNLDNIIIKIILDLTSSRRRLMRKIIDNLRKNILDENKNFFLCAHLFFCASSTRRSLNVVERRNCHHFLFSSCVLIIKSRITRQIALIISSSTKTELKNLFSWISLLSFWFFDDDHESSKICRIFFFKHVIFALRVIETL